MLGDTNTAYYRLVKPIIVFYMLLGVRVCCAWIHPRSTNNIPQKVSLRSQYFRRTLTVMSNTNNESEPKVIVIAGPTAVGKSDVASLLCQKYNGIVISADSVQAYRGVQIGANKPALEERQATPHLLIDVADHTESYNAAEWRRDALYAIAKCLNRPTTEIDIEETDIDFTSDEAESLQRRRCDIDNMIAEYKQSKNLVSDDIVQPIVVGGTMMYLQWLVDGRPDSLRPTQQALEKAEADITVYKQNNDWQGAVSHAKAQGPIFEQQVQTLSESDWYRLRRVLEVAYTYKDDKSGTLQESLYSGQRMSSLQSLGYDTRCFFICPDDRMQHTSIVDRRCEQMIINGLVEETHDLYVNNQLPDMAARAIGYRQTLDYLLDSSRFQNDDDNDDKAVTQEFLQFVNDFTTATRRYAKKQMQWFRKDANFVFIPVSMTQDKQERVEKAFCDISNHIALSRDAFLQNASDDKSQSMVTRRNNEIQGAKMKLYHPKRYLLAPGSSALDKAINSVRNCQRSMQDCQEKRDLKRIKV